MSSSVVALIVLPDSHPWMLSEETGVRVEQGNQRMSDARSKSKRPCEATGLTQEIEQ